MVSYFDVGYADVVQDYVFAFNASSRHHYYYPYDLSILQRGFDFS